MSDNILFEIQEEILKRVCRVKSLLRFRSVSKQWKALIDSSYFINQHHSFNQKTQPPHLLVAYRVLNSEPRTNAYASIVDDDSFPRNKFHHIIPHPVNLLRIPMMMPGCSHGLVCLYEKLRPSAVNGNNDAMIVVWNPLLTTCVGLAVPGRSVYVLGFGVCPKTYDLKVIMITPPPDLKVEIFTLSTGAWRTMSVKVDTCLSLESIGHHQSHVEINGVIHWASRYDRSKATKIVTFDLISEDFGKEDLPDGSLSGFMDLFNYKPKECLAIFNYNQVEKKACHVWIMKKNDDDSKSSFEKLFTFVYDGPHVHYLYYYPAGFRMNGQLIMTQRWVINNELVDTIKVYDPSSRHMNDLEIDIDADHDSYFRMTSYTESSLLMLNQPATVFQYPSS